MLKGHLLLTLNVFSATGGIEKVCRIMGKALFEIDKNLHVFSMHDNKGSGDDRYFPKNLFKSFAGSKLAFIKESINCATNKKVVILSHINLLIVGYLIKKISPSTQVMMLAHGIEVWKNFGRLKIMMLNSIDKILPVSNFTMNKMMSLNNLALSKFTVLNNCLDPYLAAPVSGPKNETLLKKYNISPSDKVLLTLTRISSSERYKGYDRVFRAMHEINDPTLKYLIIGKYDDLEKFRLDKCISALNLENRIIFAGFVADSEIADHFNLADIYVMPSEKEGFGIVFIEAMFYGKPVIAGNRDGSSDALAQGEFGKLIDPTDTDELISGIKEILQSPQLFKVESKRLVSKFGYNNYKDTLEKLLFVY